MTLLSGAFTTPESQGVVMWTVGLLSPVRHYVDFCYQVLFKGNGLTYVWSDVAGPDARRRPLPDLRTTVQRLVR